MRVLYVIPSLASRTGGPATSVVESALALQRSDVDVTIFATDMARAASARTHARAAQTDLPPGADELDVRLFRAGAPYRLAFSPEMYAALREETRGYDLVHIHSLFLFPQFAAYRAALDAGAPYIVSPHGALDPYLRRRGRVAKAVAMQAWQRAMLHRAAALHVTSPEEARLIADVAPGVPRRVVANSIDWAEYLRLPSGAAFRSRYFGGAGGPIVMYLGRVSHKKGLDTLIRAFALVQRDVPEARLAIVGPDDEGLTPGLSLLARRAGVAESVVFTSMLRGDEKLDALAAADVWTLPSHTENFGIAAVEAMAAGCATVVSPAVNIASEIAAAGAGIVAPLRAEAFAAEIVGLLRDDVRRDALGDRARAFARRYDRAAVGPQLADMYREIVGAGSRGVSAGVRLCA
jgi:glycosyltransferase involved in cell wall biosynthesis